jgi:uncharacterized protein (DUF736 family)
MAQIGIFESTTTGFAGRIRSFTLDMDVQIVQAQRGDGDNAPDYRVMLGDGDDAIEVGAGWKHVGEKAGNYLSVQIDDPVLAQPIYANLFQSSSDPTAHVLLWNRPSKRREQG